MSGSSKTSSTAPPSRTPPGKPREKRSDLVGSGMSALCGGALALNLLLVVGLLGILAWNGLGYYWQRPVELFELRDGRRIMGEIHEREPIPGDAPESLHRVRMEVANRDVDGTDFVWIDESDVVRRETPKQALLLERLEWGNFFGFPRELRHGDEILADSPDRVLRALPGLLERKRRERHAIDLLEKDEIGDVNYRMEKVRLAYRKLELEQPDEKRRQARLADLDRRSEALNARYDALSRQLFDLREELVAERLVLETAGGDRREVAVGEIVRAIQPNALSQAGRWKLYLSRVWEFLSADPRESNTEGGIFPAIFGTVMMVFLMSFVVSPLGVLAALYLREYARQGTFVRIVRIAVNNLAGVPSIVFGVFGLGFFVYLVGGTIDRLFYPEALPAPTFGTGGVLWAALTLALLTVPVVIVATEEGLAAVPRIVREGSLALGATQFETTWRVVLPAAAPGILTGVILAMARAAGEVAPLMIVGMVKLAPALPVDGYPPFVHLERKFMHLGFHIYDVGFQSPNVEAVKPLVFATALLLIGIVTLMNLVAIAVRNHLRNKYATSAV